MHGLVEIAPLPPIPQHDLLTYTVPLELQDRIQLGMRVRVPLGRQTRTGVVAGFASTPPGDAQLRAILDLLDSGPFLTPDLLELCRWTARYYLASLADVIGTIVPTRLPSPSTVPELRVRQALDPAALATLSRKAPARAAAYRLLVDAADHTMLVRDVEAAGIGAGAIRGLIEAGIAEKRLRPDTEADLPPARPGRPLVLTPAQESAAAAIAATLGHDEHACFLLHGITGSGKTEVYLNAAEHALAGDRGVIILVPEIALTHQAVTRVRARFGSGVAVLHSGLGPRERWDAWRRLASGKARVVIGARSAVFAPVARLGLVIVDEEHDGAYKQEEGVRYHARDLAVVRARLAGATAVLASATPSAESYQAALDGRHRLLELASRPTAQPLPAVEVIDLRSVPCTAESGLVSTGLRDALAHTLTQGEQALVFLNRRGFATYLQCPGCGTTASCPHCSVTLTWHRSRGALACHHCQFQRRPPTRCDACQ